MKSLNFEQVMVINLMGLMGGSVVFGLYLMNSIVNVIKWKVLNMKDFKIKGNSIVYVDQGAEFTLKVCGSMEEAESTLQDLGDPSKYASLTGQLP